MPVKKTDEESIDIADPWDPEPEDSYTAQPQNSDRDMITVSLKGGGGNQAWIVGHFNSVDEAIEVLTDDDRWSILMQLTAQRGEELQEAHGGSKKAPASPSTGRSSSGWGNKTSKPSGGSQKRSQSSEPEYDPNYDCDHGEREWVQKDTWQAWMCSSEDRDDKCDPLWANKNGSLQTKRRR